MNLVILLKEQLFALWEKIFLHVQGKIFSLRVQKIKKAEQVRFKNLSIEQKCNRIRQVHVTSFLTRIHCNCELFFILEAEKSLLY